MGVILTLPIQNLLLPFGSFRRLAVGKLGKSLAPEARECTFKSCQPDNKTLRAAVVYPAALSVYQRRINARSTAVN